MSDQVVWWDVSRRCCLVPFWGKRHSGTSFMLGYHRLHVQFEDVGWQERVRFDDTDLLSSASFRDGHYWDVVQKSTEWRGWIHLEWNPSSAQVYALYLGLTLYLFQASYSFRPLALEWMVLYTLISRPEWWWWPPFSNDPYGMEIIIPNPRWEMTGGQNRRVPLCMGKFQEWCRDWWT